MESIGFIGAGKCGSSLAEYFKSKGIDVSGICKGRTLGKEEEGFLTLPQLINRSSIIFITVTDEAIKHVWNGLAEFNIGNKIICHCSGSLSSDIFFGANKEYVCSVHPMLAFNSKHTSIENISKAFFTIEGGNAAIDVLSQLLKSTRNNFKIITKENKAKYHAAACFASNFVVSVCNKGESLLAECGFSETEAHEALKPLMEFNMKNILDVGTYNALTGPAARGDFKTIEKHMAVLGEDVDLYRLLTNVILEMKGRSENEDDC